MGGKYADCDFMKMLTTYVMSIMKEYDHVDFREMFMRVMYIAQTLRIMFENLKFLIKQVCFESDLMKFFSIGELRK
jgi:hypothetical protein